MLNPLTLVIRDTQLKITRYHFIPTKIAKIKMMKVSVGKDVGKLEPSHVAGGVLKWYSHLKMVSQLLKTLNTGLLHIGAIPLLSVYPK
jgi:hypothetical protein